jgi:penicillin-binding protein 1A
VVLTKRWIRALRLSAGVLAVLLALALAGGAYLYGLQQTLPDLASASVGPQAARTSIVYAADDSVLAEWHGDQDRRLVGLASVPKHLRDAVIASEDPRFYDHAGVDMDAVTAALGNNRTHASATITQQLVRMLFPDEKRTWTEKVREALMSYQLEAKTPKDRVLESYMNMAYFGNGFYGVESAARGYFGKPASALTLAESAVLAGVIDAPSRYSPMSDPALARTRRDEVLRRMRDLGMVSSELEVAARREPLKLVAPETPHVAPYFVEYVKQDLIARLGADRVFTGGLRVHTTLEPELQAEAESAVRAALPLSKDPEAAVVSIDPRTGRILAMVGGRDFASNQFNLAAQGRRQPGSAFKPFVLVAAFERGISPNRRFETSPITIKVKDGDWRVENYENGFTRGTLTLRAATDWSVNAVFARLVMLVGPERVADAAKRMGITSPLEANPAIALGGLTKGVSPLEMASAYGTLANGGVRVPASAIVTVSDERGRVVYRPEQKGVRVLERAVADQTSGMLHEVIERGTGTRARIKQWAAGKTGTTQSYRDAWFVGYTPDLATAVWVGYRAAQVDMLRVHGIRVAGGTFPAMIWGRYMSRIGVPVRAAVPGGSAAEASATAVAPKERGIVHVRICRDTFLLANPRCPDVLEVDLETQYVPKSVCTKH